MMTQHLQVTRFARGRRGPAAFPAVSLQAICAWAEGGRRRNCAARLLHAGRRELDLLIYGSPAPGRRVDLHFLDPPWSGPARVIQLAPADDGAWRAIVKLGRMGWLRWRSAYSAPAAALHGTRTWRRDAGHPRRLGGPLVPSAPRE